MMSRWANRRRHLIAYAVMLLIVPLIAVVGAASPAIAAPVTFSGVVGGASGAVVTGGSVYLYNQSGGSAGGATAADGSFSLQAAPGIYSGSAYLSLESVGNLLAHFGGLDLSSGNVARNFTLPAIVTAQVRVLDALGSPVAGAYVYRSDAPEGRAVVWSGGPAVNIQYQHLGSAGFCLTDSAGQCGLKSFIGANPEDISVSVPNGQTVSATIPAVTGTTTTLTVNMDGFAVLESVGSATGSLTISTSDGSLTNVANTAVAGDQLPSGATVLTGSLAYEVHEVPVGGSVDVTMALPAGAAPTGVFKFQDGVYVDVTSLATISGDTIVLHLTDGGLGDDDGVANGVIVDPVAAVRAVAPSAPKAAAASPGSTSVSVSWVAPLKNGGAAVSGYVVTPYVGGVAQAPRTFASTATSQEITGLVAGTAYSFRVAAVNTVGTGARSAPSAVVTVGAPTSPTIVKNATAGNAEATVSWTAPASGNGSPVTGYVVTPYVGYYAFPPVVFNSTATTQVITGRVINGLVYQFRVQAINAVGVSGYSKVTNPVTASTTLAPGLGAPTIIKNATGGGNSSATLSWIAPTVDGGSPVTGYLVTPYVGYYAFPSYMIHSTSTTQTVTGLASGFTYRFRVQAVNAVGTGGFSTVTNPVTPTP